MRKDRGEKEKKEKIIWVNINGKKIPKRLNMVETLEDVDPAELSESEGPWDYDSNRVLDVKKAATPGTDTDEDTYVQVTPKGATYRNKVKWTTDSRGAEDTFVREALRTHPIQKPGG